MFTDAYPAAACTKVRSARRRHDFSVFSSFKRSLLFVPASVFKKGYSCFVRCKLAYKVLVAFILILDEFTELTHRLLKPCHRPVYLYNNRHHRNKRADKRDGSRNRFPAYFFHFPSPLRRLPSAGQRSVLIRRRRCRMPSYDIRISGDIRPRRFRPRRKTRCSRSRRPIRPIRRLSPSFRRMKNPRLPLLPRRTETARRFRRT